MNRGYFGIGIYHVKSRVNIGTLWRSAHQLGAAFIFTVGKRYSQQSSDTCKAWRHVPLYHYSTIDDLITALPYSCSLIGIEMGGVPLGGYSHPERATYLLGAEDHGLPAAIIERCHHLISIEAVNTESYNVAVAGSLVMYQRFLSYR